MGELGDALSFEAYAASLRRYAAMEPAQVGLVQTAVVGGLAAAALVLFAMMIVRRSGTAAAGFALVALVALLESMLFGGLEFLTGGTKILIGALTASALVLFVNAVLHTGRENLVIAGLSAVVIGLTLTLGGLTAMGMDYAAQARLGMVGAALFAALVLAFAMMRASAGRTFLGVCVFVAILAGALMLDQVSPALDGLAASLIPATTAAAAIALASLAAPFVADEMTVSGSHSSGAGVMEPGPLFQTYDGEPAAPAFHGDHDRGDVPWSSDQVPAPRRPDEDGGDARTPASSPLEQPPRLPDPDRDPVSSRWGAGSGPLEAEPNEYVWDPLASPEVRCGREVLAAFGAATPRDLPPEGLREALDPSVLADFDEEVLGGGDPLSGPFDVLLRGPSGELRFRGRRQVDHEGILMRLQGEIERAPGSAPSIPANAPVSETPLSRLSSGPQFATIVRLTDRQPIGFDATPPAPVGSDSEAKALIDEAAAQLARKIADDPRRGPFAVIDAAALGVRFGVVASGLGKAVRVHGLPRGAFLIGLDPARIDGPRAAEGAIEDIRAAGGGVALILRDTAGRIGKIRPDMVFIDAADAHLGGRGRRGPIAALGRKLGAPVLIRGVRSDFEATDAAEQGAIFASGRPFAADTPEPPQTPAGLEGRPADPPDRGSPGFSARTPLRAQGLR